MLLKIIVQTYLAFVTVTSLCLATSTVQPFMMEVQDNLTSVEVNVLANISETQYDFSEEFLSCVKIMVAAHHYELLENNSVYVPIYKELYDSRNYFINNGTLFLCSPSKIVWYQEPSMKFRNRTHYTIGSILTVVFLILSCVCLGLHLCIFLIVPEFKTLTGKNTATIAVCLLLAYSLFLVGGSVKNTDSCSRMAAAIFYFFLSSFFWMNCFAFDVWLSLNTSIKILNKFLNKTKESIRYLIYAFYSFGIPMIIVEAAIIVDAGIIGGEDFVPVFSKKSCWFQSYKSFILFFITPYVILTTLDVILFVLTIATIAKLKVADGKHEFSPKRRFILCMRLAAVTGLPWFVGIIAMLAQWEPLWYMFIVLTTLQGVYIFVAYNCNRKTVKYLLAAVRKEQKSPSTSTVKSASSPV